MSVAKEPVFEARIALRQSLSWDGGRYETGRVAWSTLWAPGSIIPHRQKTGQKGEAHRKLCAWFGQSQTQDLQHKILNIYSIPGAIKLWKTGQKGEAHRKFCAWFGQSQTQDFQHKIWTSILYHGPSNCERRARRERHTENSVLDLASLKPRTFNIKFEHLFYTTGHQTVKHNQKYVL